MKEPIDRYSAFLAALITLAACGLIALLCWSAGPGPDWILATILGGGALALLFCTVYNLIASR